MELGARIKTARLEAGLSQRQLCGDTITRNMLSLIESGRAKPSMDTLAYLAARLGKPMGYFLEEQAVTSPNQQVMSDARAAYAQGQFRQALAALEEYREPDGLFDPERWLLEALAAMDLAEQALNGGKTAYAAALLESAGAAGKKSLYYTGELERRRLLLQFQAAPEQAAELAAALPSVTRELLLRGCAAMATGDAALCARILDAVTDRDARWYLLRGEAAMAQEDYSTAVKWLHQAEAQYPRRCIPALERCYRELEDYKNAYAYACKGRMDN